MGGDSSDGKAHTNRLEGHDEAIIIIYRLYGLCFMVRLSRHANGKSTTSRSQFFRSLGDLD